jgi:hypothetical protein
MLSVALVMNDPLTRAYFEYFARAVRSPEATVFPSSKHSGIESFNRKIFVSLRSLDGSPLIVYRIRGNGYLRRVFRWPANLNYPPQDDGSLFKRLPAIPPPKERLRASPTRIIENNV